MDFDSSSKFISSLAKFLQSLCNGYVEFNNGVEVIGHIYLNVDTGKKIDYILNEKVCKTDENSVTFISNSFHAQPAEKPKPPGKNAAASDPIKHAESKADEEDIIIMEEPESKNVGTVPTRDSFQHSASSHPKSGRPAKRSYNQSFPSSHKHLSKQSRPDHPSLLVGPNGAQQDTDSLHSESNSSSNLLPTQLSGDTTLTAASESDMTHLSKVFPQNLEDSTNNQSAAEERDIKPQLDSDMNIIHVKQEYDPSDQGAEEDPESYDDSQDQGSVFPGMPYDQYYGDGSRRGQRLDFNQMGGMAQGEFFQGGAGPSGEAGDSSEGSRYDTIRGSEKGRLAGDSFSYQAQSRDANCANNPSNDKDNGPHKCWCYHCDKGFSSELLLVQHLNSHLHNKPFQCEKCPLSFMHRSTLKRHQKVCGGSYTLKQHKCPFCERSFTYRHDLKRHCKNIHVEANDQGFL